MTKFEKYRHLLDARKLELDKRLVNIETELDEAPHPDFAENATQREDDEVLEQLGNEGLVELQKINAALKRIDDDSFGFCLRCDKPISEERLNVLPFATLCRTCAHQLENQ
ncbi:MAG: TraR/DksA C4-type zinc finger protein [Rhizobiaceae bacterium]|nr:TraR/DksA C4-type zinc finger protein [Rhizobiaceae bacterium]